MLTLTLGGSILLTGFTEHSEKPAEGQQKEQMNGDDAADSDVEEPVIGEGSEGTDANEPVEEKDTDNFYEDEVKLDVEPGSKGRG